jgi:hypothetical protein
MNAPSATDPAPTRWVGPILAGPVAHSVAGNPNLFLSATLTKSATKIEERLDRIT